MMIVYGGDRRSSLLSQYSWMLLVVKPSLMMMMAEVRFKRARAPI